MWVGKSGRGLKVRHSTVIFPWDSGFSGGVIGRWWFSMKRKGLRDGGF
jgi:hypothetical protein